MSMIRKSVTIPEMINQSIEVVTSPSVPTFEKYEKNGTLGNATIYVAIGAAISGLLGIFSGGIGGAISGVLVALAQFFVFTGLVYYIGQQQGGSGTWDEVAYTFSLFSVPLTIIGAVVGLVLGLLIFIPIINILAGFAALIISLLLLVAQIYFGYLAVQSSMNLREQNKAIITLVLAAVGTFIAVAIVGTIAVSIAAIFS
jgi:Yip1 domain